MPQSFPPPPMRFALTGDTLVAVLPSPPEDTRPPTPQPGTRRGRAGRRAPWLRRNAGRSSP